MATAMGATQRIIKCRTFILGWSWLVGRKFVYIDGNWWMAVAKDSEAHRMTTVKEG